MTNNPAVDVNKIFGRLFDHRPFLEGEITNFKREFEDKRGDREIEKLFRVLELITEIKQAQCDKIIESTDANLPRTIADIQVALHMCEETAKVENCLRADDLLKKKREERVQRLKVAEQEIQAKEQLIEENFLQKKAELQKQYESLEKNLK